MGYWENTTYVRCKNIGRITSTVTEVFSEEGYLLIPRPPLRKPASFDSMQYGTSADNSLWAVAVIAGVSDWTVLKTAPFELLIERPAPRRPFRLADICRRLGVDSFYYGIYDSDQSLLVEVSASGIVRASGFCPDYGNGFAANDGFSKSTYNDEPLDLNEGFSLIVVEPSISAALRSFRDDRALGMLLCGQSGAHDNMIQVENLIPHRPLEIPNAIDLYFRRK